MQVRGLSVDRQDRRPSCNGLNGLFLCCAIYHNSCSVIGKERDALPGQVAAHGEMWRVALSHRGHACGIYRTLSSHRLRVWCGDGGLCTSWNFFKVKQDLETLAIRVN